MRALVIVCLAAALVPLVPRPTHATRNNSAVAREWPEPFRSMQQEQLSDTERRFAAGDRLGRFQQDGRRWLVRSIEDASRRVHPAEECYRATGWRIGPRPAQLSSGGGTEPLARPLKWGCFSARRGAEAVEVCQTTTDESGRSWSDVGSWWWSAAFGKSKGPWLGVVRVTEEGQASWPVSR
jgi:hypothetical protein